MSSPYAIMLQELKERKKWKNIHKTVLQFETERQNALNNWQENGFESQEAAQNWFVQHDQSLLRLDSTAKKFGKDSKQYKYNLFIETIALAKITPEGFKPPMSKSKKAAIVVGAAAIVGAAAFVAMKMKEKSKQDDPSDYKVVDVPVEIGREQAVDGTQPQIEVPESLKEKLLEALKSDDYKQQLADLTAQTNQRIETANANLQEALAQISTLDANSGIDEMDITHIPQRIGIISGFYRNLDESFMSFVVRGKEHGTSYYDAHAEDYFNGFYERFPHFIQVLEEHGYDIRYLPNLTNYNSSIRELEEQALAIDELTSDISWHDYISSVETHNIVNAASQQITCSRFEQDFLDAMTPEQAQQMQGLLDEANRCYNAFDTILTDYNTAVENLQHSIIDNNLIQVAGDALSSSNITNDALANKLNLDGNNLSDKVVESAKEALEQTANVASDLLENGFTM